MEDGNQFSIHSVCRICLDRVQNENAYDLFLVPGLAKKLCVCTSLSVEPQDGFPKNLCGVCYTRLNDLHGFQRQCVDSVQKFQELLASNTFNCGPVNTFELGINDNCVDNGNEEDDRLNFDPLLNHKMELIENEDDVFKMLETVDKEVEEAEKEETKTERRDDSFFSSNESSSLSNESDHWGDDNDDEDDDFHPNSSDSEDDKPLAHRLRKSTKSKPRKKITEDEKPPKPKRKRIPAAERHLHRIIDCHICHQKFKKAIRFEEHMKYHNDKLPYQCTVESCKKGFTTENALRLHIDHAHVELAEVHACSVEGCGRTFPRSRLLTWHMKKVHNILKDMMDPKMHPCTECDKVFKCPTALKKHMFKHDGKELPYPCNICGKRFVINSALKHHLMRHAGIKNYVCPYCGVGKTTKQEWNKHILTHTQEKKYKCHMCEHASHNKQALANHVRVIHEKIRKYTCQFCGKPFGKSYSCKLHELTHTGGKPCECKVCGKRFMRIETLTKHLKTHEKRVVNSAENLPKKTEQQLTAGVSGGATMQQVIGQPFDLNPPQQQQEQQQSSNMVANEMLFDAFAQTMQPRAPKKDPRRVERVDISQLAGTAINPIQQVSVPSWSPQVNFTKKEGKHICPGCGRGFNNIGNMKLHYKIIHEKIKDFACRFCPRRFSKAQILKHHEYTHTGEKPFTCEVCGNAFRQVVQLKRHRRVHERDPDDKPRSRKSKKQREMRIEIDPEKYQAVKEELEEHERERLEAKRKQQQERQAIAEAAFEQLEELRKQTELEKIQNTYESYQAAAAAEAEAAKLAKNNEEKVVF